MPETVFHLPYSNRCTYTNTHQCALVNTQTCTHIHFMYIFIPKVQLTPFNFNIFILSKLILSSHDSILDILCQVKCTFF